MVATRSFFRVLACVGAVAFAALAAQPSYEAARAAVVAQYGLVEARTLAGHERESREAREARLIEEIRGLQGQLDAASRRAAHRNPTGDFPPPPPHYARLN